MTTLGFVIGPLEFESPIWLWGVPVLVFLSVVIARRSLAGLDSGWKVVALAVRFIVLTLLVSALAEPLWRKPSEDLAVTAIVDMSDSIPLEKQRDVQEYIQRAVKTKDRPGDRLGVITTAREAFVEALPSQHFAGAPGEHQGSLDATDLASGVRLGIATMPRDAGNRFMLVTDGNQTAGDLLQAAAAAKALGIKIDVLPIRFEYDGEVMVDKLVAPAAAREGESVNVRIVLQSSRAASGRIHLLMNGTPIDLDPASDSLGRQVRLEEGQNVLWVPVSVPYSGPQKFEAVFEPETRGGIAVADALPQNNKSVAVTFVAGEGRVLVVANNDQESGPLVKALTEASIRCQVVTPDMAPTSLTEMSTYDAIVLVNQSAYGFTQQQQEDFRQYVHDTGGGLIMTGGPESFGAGGWIGSPLEEALPIKLDPPQKRQMPRGALVLCIHSVEIPEGVFWGKKVCEAAVNRLSRLDYIGINEYGWQGGTNWTFKPALVGDGTAVKRAINNLRFGDMPDFTPSFQMTLAEMKKLDAGQRHMILISDGDPQIPPTSLLQDFKDAGITVSAVGIGCHGMGEQARMQEIARLTDGRFYEVQATAAGLAKLPEIFMKEAMTVRRSLIYERPGPGIAPVMYAGASEPLRGIGRVPNINGYVVTAEREGLALVTAKVAGGDPNEGDPLIAQWQYGLGRTVAFTSDASTRWGGQWVSWEGFRQFWEQHARWVLRPQGSANVRVVTENKGDSTVITVEATDSQGERLSFANFRGRLSLPGGEAEDVQLVQTAPGRYQASVPTEKSGSYVLSLRYAAPDPNVEGGVLEGSVQAAISRPFADEYRVLRDNTALLTQVAELTGGRVLSGDPAQDELWNREGIELPVAKTPAWLAFTVVGLAIFVVDVGVRRVRLDWAMIAAFARGVFGRSKAASATQLGGLRAAREQARHRIAERAQAANLTPDQLERQAKDAAKAASATAKVKFEADAETLKRASRETPSIAIGGADARPAPIVEKPRPVDQKTQPGEGMSRLMQAKKKAKEGMDE
ncbi:MAG TPA: VWA domain-containing protein [Phycisphaerales bacterium]|nr:VWA domain-containing protein [Phycisphaerales bacterium]